MHYYTLTIPTIMYCTI